MPTGLAPEIAELREGTSRVAADSGARHNLLRPETVESLFVLWRQTGKPRYREWGWEIFRAFERHCKVEGGGYSGLRDVTAATPFKNGKMESFFTAETLKFARDRAEIVPRSCRDPSGGLAGTAPLATGR